MQDYAKLLPPDAKALLSVAMKGLSHNLAFLILVYKLLVALENRLLMTSCSCAEGSLSVLKGCCTTSVADQKVFRTIQMVCDADRSMGNQVNPKDLISTIMAPNIRKHKRHRPVNPKTASSLRVLG